MINHQEQMDLQQNFFNFFGLILDLTYLIPLNVVLILVSFLTHKHKESFQSYQKDKNPENILKIGGQFHFLM